MPPPQGPIPVAKTYESSTAGELLPSHQVYKAPCQKQLGIRENYLEHQGLASSTHIEIWEATTKEARDALREVRQGIKANGRISTRFGIS